MYGAEVIEVTEKNIPINNLCIICLIFFLIIGVIGIVVGCYMLYKDYPVGAVAPITIGILCILTSIFVPLLGTNSEQIYTIKINNETDVEELCKNCEIIETNGMIWNVKYKEKTPSD